MAKLVSPPRRIPNVVLLLAGVAAVAGTGGVMHAPAPIGYALPQLALHNPPGSSQAAIQIRNIVSNLSISHAALARVMQVSRQTVYNWLNGALPTERCASLLSKLAQVNAKLASSVEPARAILNKPLHEGKSFWQLVQGGSEPDALVEKLLSLQSGRADQRTLMQKRLAEKRARGTLRSGVSDDLI